MKMTLHPFANSIPSMQPDEYAALVNDIKANGLLLPITLYKGKILDGRHRAKACQALKIKPSCDEFVGGDAEAKAFVLSINAHRRHLSMKQRRDLIAAELKSDPAQSDRSIARKAKVSDKTVAAARKKSNAEIPHKDERKEESGRKARGRKPATAPSQQPTVEAPPKTTESPVTKPGDLTAARLLKELAGIKPGDLSEPNKFASELFNHMKRFATTFKLDMGRTA